MTPLIKVCGLAREEDVLLCHKLGVDFTGFIFVRTSPRYISPSAVAALPLAASARVGVFVNEPVESMRSIMEEAKLDFAQLHGKEDVATCRAVGPERVIKVLWPDAMNEADFARAVETFAPVCAYFLLDAGKGGGGSGKTVEQPYLKGFSFPCPWLLAGGIGPENAVALYRAYAPDGLDLNSALETAPGSKDKTLLRAAMGAMRALV